MSYLPLQNVSKGEINRFHIALYFLTHAHSLPSQALPYFLLSDWARSHFYSFPSDWATSPPNNWGYCSHTVYYALLFPLSRTKTGPTPCKFQSKVCTIERTGTQYLIKFFYQYGVQLARRHERHVVSVGTMYKTKFNTSCKFKVLLKNPDLYVKLSLSGPRISTIVAGPLYLTPSQT